MASSARWPARLIRDFMSYDPGRYYWSAAVLYVLGGNSLLNLRVAIAAVQAMGLFTGLWLIARSDSTASKRSLWFDLLAAATLLAWMFPRHKMFDIAASIFLIGILSQLVRNSQPRNYFLVGLGVELVAVFGRNHGVYGAIGSFCVMIWLRVGGGAGCGFLRGLGLWVCGVIIGFLPILLMALLIPGFGSAFVESLRFLFEQGATNLPLAAPWPWTVSFRTLPPGDAVRALLIGCFFVGSLMFTALGIAWVVFRRLLGADVQPTLVASVFLALPYAHYAFSRADMRISPRVHSHYLSAA